MLIEIMRVRKMMGYALRKTLTRSLIGCEWTHMGALSEARRTWLVFEDLDLFVDTAACFSLHGVTQAELTTLRLGGTGQDSTDYAPRLGLYRVVK